MMKSVRIFMATLLLVSSLTVQAGDDALRHTTDVLCLLPDATALGVTIAKHDTEGMKQLGLSTATCLALNYGLELCIRKDRPDGTGHHAFPSTHTAVAFNGSTFLMKRYGWKWGVPAYVVSSFVAWGRVKSDRHDWWDVLGGAAIGAGTAYIFTKPFVKDVDVSIAPTAFGESGYGLTATIQF
ncbi:MAG: phosphatase PAP2 family protein [Muribaculaceae bacterium]|nr:phosphatase PAP2 family protein [Muribaculaceae bacterium]